VVYFTHNAAAQSAYPVKPVRIIASQSAGGGVDTVARLLAARLSEVFGQQVIVDNRAGANGSLAAEITAKSPPDGYTLMLGAVGNLGVNQFFIKQMNYDAAADLAPITQVISSSSVLVTHPALPVKSVKELIALARAKPGTLAHGSSGVGGAGHLAGALFQSMTQTKMLHVPYKGGAPAMVDIIAGQVQFSFASTPTAIPNITSGRIRALAVTLAQRTRLLPQTPTIAEAGVSGYESSSWYGAANHLAPGESDRADHQPRGRYGCAAQGGVGAAHVVARRVWRIHQIGGGEVGPHHQGTRHYGELT
jgi:tripartite-type tricarboxylate transporter receptor subunit TctC